MTKVETRIDPLEIDGHEYKGLPKDEDQLIVRAHWNRESLAVLEFQGKKITVVISQLQKALVNAGNKP